MSVPEKAPHSLHYSSSALSLGMSLNVNPPTVFFFLVVFWLSLNFHMKWLIVFGQKKKKKTFWDFDKDCIEPVEHCGTHFHFNKISIISVLIHEFGLFPFYLDFL